MEAAQGTCLCFPGNFPWNPLAGGLLISSQLFHPGDRGETFGSMEETFGIMDVAFGSMEVAVGPLG